MNLAPLGLTAATLARVRCRRGACRSSSGQLLAACRVALGARRTARRAVGERRARPRPRVTACASRCVDDDGLHGARAHAARTPTRAIPDLAPIFPAANRMQRAAFDLVGVAVRRRRPAAVAVAWRAGRSTASRCAATSRRRRSGSPGRRTTRSSASTGDGVHEIPVGPVHAGIIEPGHFRFQVVGEKVLRLEERLGYVHKGIEKRFEALSLADGDRLAGRVSGDSTVAYALGVRAGRWRRSRGVDGAAARARGCARSRSSASASPTTSATWATSATTAASRSASRSSRASRRTCCAPTSRRSAIGC